MATIWRIWIMDCVLDNMCSVTQLCLTLCDPMDCSLPGSSVRGIFQARTLEWVAMSSSWRSSWARYQTHVSCIGRQILYHWATWEASLFDNSIDLMLNCPIIERELRKISFFLGHMILAEICRVKVSKCL